MGTHWGGSNVYPRLCFKHKKKRKYHLFHLKISIFTAVKYYSILHGHVCVMCWRTVANGVSFRAFTSVRTSSFSISYSAFLFKCDIVGNLRHISCNFSCGQNYLNFTSINQHGDSNSDVKVCFDAKFKAKVYWKWYQCNKLHLITSIQWKNGRVV